jgi:hypothetical protein
MSRDSTVVWTRSWHLLNLADANLAHRRLSSRSTALDGAVSRAAC